MILGALVSLALVANDELATAVVAVTAVAFVRSTQSAPAAALLSDSVERVGLGQERAAELLNVAWAGARVIGRLAAGALASLIAFQAPFVALAVAFLLTLVATSAQYGKR